jgi:hypothetical protein
MYTPNAAVYLSDSFFNGQLYMDLCLELNPETI